MVKNRSETSGEILCLFFKSPDVRCGWIACLPIGGYNQLFGSLELIRSRAMNNSMNRRAINDRCYVSAVLNLAYGSRVHV